MAHDLICLCIGCSRFEGLTNIQKDRRTHTHVELVPFDCNMISHIWQLRLERKLPCPYWFKLMLVDSVH